MVDKSPPFSTRDPVGYTATSTVLCKIKSETVLVYKSKVEENLPLLNSIPKFVSAFSSHFKSGFASVIATVLSLSAAGLNLAYCTPYCEGNEPVTPYPKRTLSNSTSSNCKYLLASTPNPTAGKTPHLLFSPNLVEPSLRIEAFKKIASS